MPGTLLFRFLAAAVAACLFLAGPASAQSSGPRIALVIGNAQYADPLATSANDAGLIAETLRGAGFDVTGAANLDQESLRRAFRDFLGKAAQAGPDAIAFVYLAGRGLQYAGDNYFAPIDANIQHDTDIPLQALRLSDFTRALASVPLRARIVVLDGARGNHFAPGGNLAGGLALVEADPGALYAFNAAPGTIAPDEPGPYGAYAQALAEMLRQGGVPVDDAFAQARLRANEATRGAITPWDAANITPPLILLEAAANAPAPATSVSYAAAQSRPIASFPANEAYAAALERDTMAGYQDFLATYPNDPLAGRVRALLAARREALTWRRTLEANTPDACWSYMRRYPKGPHYYDARRRLTYLSAPVEPPPSFEVYDFEGLPPPPPPEIIIIDRPVLIFDPGMYPPPPPPPVYFLPPQPVAFIELPPPPPPEGPGFLPIPIPVPVPFGRYNGPQGVVIQQNFGQQGPVGQGGAPGPGAGHAGQPVPVSTVPVQTVPGQTVPGQTAPGAAVPGTPGQGAGHAGSPVPGQTAPGAAVPGAPGQGAGHAGAPVPGQTAPGAPGRGAGHAGAPVPGQTAPGAAVPGTPGQGAGHAGAPVPGQTAPGAAVPGTPGQGAGHAGASVPGQTAAPPSAGAPTSPAAPNHALPQGAGLPPLPAGGHAPGTAAPTAPVSAPSLKPTAAPATPATPPATPPSSGAPNQALPQGTSLPPVPHGMRGPGAGGEALPAPSPAGKPAPAPAAPAPAHPAPMAAPKPQAAPAPQSAPSQAPRPQPQAVHPPSPPPQAVRPPSPPPQAPRPQPEAVHAPSPPPQAARPPSPPPQAARPAPPPQGARPGAKPGEENHP